MKKNGLSKKGYLRRDFLKIAGLAFGTSGVILSNCKVKERDQIIPNQQEIDLGAGDKGILNYLFVLEQLEAMFYTKVTTSIAFEFIFEPIEQTLLLDMLKHEIIHRNFLLKFIRNINDFSVPVLEIDLSGIDFTSRKIIIETAQFFKEIIISAYNGIVSSFLEKNYLIIASKLMSVEARHSIVLGNLLLVSIPGPNTSFAINYLGTLDRGFDKAAPPSQILELVQKYFKNKIIGSRLPVPVL